MRDQPEWSVGVTLSTAIEFKRLDWLPDLLDLGVVVDVRSTDFSVPTRGATGFMVAAFWGRTPLMTATGIESYNWSEAHPLLVERLIRAGARLDEEDDEGVTALSLANAEGHSEAIDLLRGGGARDRPRPRGAREVDIGAVRGAIAGASGASGPEGRVIDAPMESATRWPATWLANSPPRQLVEQGLMSAAAHGNPAVVERFPAAGADTRCRTALGERALKNAAVAGRDLVIEVLRDRPTLPGEAAVAARWAQAEGHMRSSRILNDSA